MKRVILLAAMLLSCVCLHAQEKSCGTKLINDQLMQNDPAFRAQQERMKAKWSQYKKDQAAERIVITGVDTMYEIPIVVHVVHTGGPIGSTYNPTDASIITFIDYLNQTYAASWAAYPSPGNGGTKVPFRFVLAKRDPNCMPTTGILRVDGSVVPGYVANGVKYGSTAGVDELLIKNLSRWPNNQYYNIWLVNDIGAGTIAGYAYYPGAGPLVDGTIMLTTYASVGTSTLAHEIGHGLGLPHTFEGSTGAGCPPPETDCTMDGDGVCDTEPHPQTIDCATLINPCTGTSMNFTQHSFMSYSHGCRDRFTPGQKEKMLYNLKNNRTALMHSIGAELPPPMAVPSLCIPTIANASSTLDAGPIFFSFNTINRASGGYTTEGNKVYVDNFCTSHTIVYQGSSYPVSVQTGNGVQNVRMFIDYNNDGQFQPTELVFSSNGSGSFQMHSGTINIPASGSVLCQPLRVRVVSDVQATANPGPCGVLAHGQAEDYLVTVKAATSGNVAMAITKGNNPGCKDSILEFTANTTVTPVLWLINGVPVAAGPTYTTNSLVTGDEVVAAILVPNSACGTPDTIRSNSVVIAFTSGSTTPPFISFINGMLVSDVAPVQWVGPNGVIPGAVGQSYQPTAVGEYHALSTTTGCPSGPSNKLWVGKLDIHGMDMRHVRIHPNPASNEIVVELEQGSAARVRLYDAMGRMVTAQEGINGKAVLNVSSLPNGSYFISLIDDAGKTGIVKISVKH